MISTPGKSDGTTRREKRLAASLRDNLKRRKAQARERSEAAGAVSEIGCDMKDTPVPEASDARNPTIDRR